MYVLKKVMKTLKLFKDLLIMSHCFKKKESAGV